jgi:flagellar basal body-associated protein FliL
MAEEKDVKKDAEPKKGKKAKGGKKGRTMVMAALVVVLAAGGYFGMNRTKGAKPEPKGIHIVEDQGVINLGEYMVNTSDGQSFLKATVVVQLAAETNLFGEASGGHGEAPGVEAMAPYVDAVREVLASQSIANLSTAAGEEKLKRLIAAKINELYRKRNPKAELPAPAKAGAHPHWHSDSGPVLIVYLTELLWEQS